MDSSAGSMVLLTRLNRLVYRHATEEALGMRLKQFALLSMLRDQGSVSQQALGEQMHVDPNNLVLLLNDAEANGWVERRRDPTDRRRHIVVLTDAGVEALKRAEEAIEDVEDQVLGPLNAEERANLRRLLQKAAGGDVQAADAA
jgi:MarR family transcriptional regulator, temperature-dependent positive regulator of motility